MALQESNPSEPELGLDNIISSVETFRKTVEKWVSKAPKEKKRAAEEYLATSTPINSRLDPFIGRPPRLGLGAKPPSQKEQYSGDSIFASQKLKELLLGRKGRNENIEKHESKKIVPNYSNKTISKRDHDRNSRLPKPSVKRRHTDIVDDGDSDSDKDSSRAASFKTRNPPS